MPRPFLLCAFPFGYGPAAKLLVIEERLRAAGGRSVFVGAGIAHELVQRSAGLFEDVVAARASDPLARSLVSNAAGVVSVMDRGFAARAIELDTPLYVVDSLLFIRDGIPAAFAGAKHYWVQNFPGVATHRVDSAASPTLVGPIVRDGVQRKPVVVPRLIINLGGYAAPADNIDDHYAEFVLRGILNSPFVDFFGGKILVMGGAACVDRLRARFENGDLEFTSLSHEAALEELSRAAAVLTSPGLTTTTECSARPPAMVRSWPLSDTPLTPRRWSSPMRACWRNSGSER